VLLDFSWHFFLDEKNGENHTTPLQAACWIALLKNFIIQRAIYFTYWFLWSHSTGAVWYYVYISFLWYLFILKMKLCNSSVLALNFTWCYLIFGSNVRTMFTSFIIILDMKLIDWMIDWQLFAKQLMVLPLQPFLSLIVVSYRWQEHQWKT